MRRIIAAISQAIYSIRTRVVSGTQTLQAANLSDYLLLQPQEIARKI